MCNQEGNHPNKVKVNKITLQKRTRTMKDPNHKSSKHKLTNQVNLQKKKYLQIIKRTLDAITKDYLI